MEMLIADLLELAKIGCKEDDNLQSRKIDSRAKRANGPPFLLASTTRDASGNPAHLD